MFDYIIIGAGYAGAVLAERLATQKGASILVIDKRTHIGGNCYDSYDANHVLIHNYGPHLFHTNNAEVVTYLNHFTEWRAYQHHVLASVEGIRIPVPFNFNSIEMLFPREKSHRLISALLDSYPHGSRVPILELMKKKNKDIKFLASYIYDNIFVNYTAKQWGCRPEEINPEVTGRVPVVLSRDNRYFQDKYQQIPINGYTQIFKNMLRHPHIKTMLNTDFKDIMSVDHQKKTFSLMGHSYEGRVIYTGMVDELFDYEFGALPYRSLRFDFQYETQPFYQPTAVVNYPNEHDFTRITEFKRITGQEVVGTTIAVEYPQDFDTQDESKNIPYYPIFRKDNQESYQQYVHHAQGYRGLFLVGRLAEYRYYDMDDIVARSLDVFKDL